MRCSRRTRLCKWLAGLALILGGLNAAAAEPPDDLSYFVEPYRCTVVELLAHIHGRPHPEQMYRYLVLENAATHSYVQCLFFDRDRQMLCEAWSGWWDKKGNGPGFKPDIAPEELHALAKLGFSTDASHGNFRRYFRFREEPDYDAIADLMLTALYAGYDTRVATGVEGNGPYAMRRGLLRKNRCVPIS